MQIYFHSRLCSYLSRVPILVEGTVDTFSVSGDSCSTGVELNNAVIINFFFF